MRRMIVVLTVVLALFFTTDGYAGNVSKAKEFMKADMYPQAIALLEKEIYGDEMNQATANPANAEAHYLLGVCLVQKGNFNQADERFASAVKLKPDYGYKIGNVYKDAGQAFLADSKVGAADELFKKAIIYDPALGKGIGSLIFQAGKHYENGDLISLAASYDQGLRRTIAEYYHSLSKTAEGEENKVDLLGMSARYDNTYEDEYNFNRQAVGQFHLNKAKELAKKPGKDLVTEEHRRLAKKYLGSEVMNKELPEEVVYGPGTYTFSVKSGEQTTHWIRFVAGVTFSISSKDFEYYMAYKDGQILKDGENVQYPQKTWSIFKLQAIKDEPAIIMIVK